MDVRDLEYVLAVEQCGTVGKAADMLGLTQPSLTKAVRRVEALLGVMLFERTSTGMRVTQAGVQFLTRAKRLRRDYDDALAEMRSIRTGEQGAVRLGYSPSLPDALLVASCRRLMRERPAARLRLRRRLAKELLDALRDGEIDVAVMPLPGPTAEFATEALYEDRLAVVADARHPLLARPRLELSDLQGEEWLLPEGHITIRQSLEDAFERHGLAPPALRIEADFSSEALFQLIAGTNILTISRCGQITRSAGLEPLNLLVDGLELNRSIGLVTRTGGYLSAVCCRLIDLFREEASQSNMAKWL